MEMSCVDHPIMSGRNLVSPNN